MDNLFMLLLLVAFVGVIVSLIQMIITIIKKSGKDRRKQFFIFLGLFIVSIIGFSNTYEGTGTTVASTKEEVEEEKLITEESLIKETPDEVVKENRITDKETPIVEKPDKPEPTKTTEAPKPVEVEKKTKEPELKEIENVYTDDELSESERKIFEDLALALFNENFKGMAEVSLNRENKTFNMKPINDVATSVTALGTTHKGNAEIQEAWDGMVDNFKYMSESISETLPGYTVNFLNPLNEELTLLSIYDGIVIYDFTNEF